ncbi:MAG TPA: nucleoside hydrolase [Opitutus sp.]|nr:nucleoside hydrolase [Opitutus sp.]
MKRRRFLLVVGFISLIAAALGRPIPVVFHTDIGTDIDDAWALAQILRTPALDLKFVLTDTGDTRYRAALAAKELEAANRTDVAIGIGQPTPHSNDTMTVQSWLKGFDLKNYPGQVYDDGIGAFIDFVMHSPEPVTIISTGPCPSLAAALAREPGIAARCRFVGMDGSIDIGYGKKAPAAAESNVKVDPAAFRKVLSAPWRDRLITPLDTCGSVYLKGDDYHAIWCATGDPLLRAVIESYCIFAPNAPWMRVDYFTTQSTTLFDCVAVYLASSEDLVETETMRLRVTDDGFTVRDPDGSPVRVALRWKNLAAFDHQLVRTLLAAPAAVAR